MLIFSLKTIGNMDKETIVNTLVEKDKHLFLWVSKQNDEAWETGPEGKWTMGQQVLHLLQSAKALNAFLSLPKAFLKFKYGTVNRELRDYDTVINRYKERLEKAKGQTFKASRNMKVPKLKDKAYLIIRLQVEHKKLQYKTEKRWSDKHLDTLVIPHPLMGKMPVRELVMWMSYHIEHHTKQLIDYY